VKERCGNVYENKGPAFSSPGRSGNVIENEGGYALKAGMLLKRQDSGFRIRDSGSEGADSRRQD
jgi:hypothetical protein